MVTRHREDLHPVCGMIPETIDAGLRRSTVVEKNDDTLNTMVDSHVKPTALLGMTDLFRFFASLKPDGNKDTNYQTYKSIN